MKQETTNRFLTGCEEEKFSYFRIPKIFVQIPRFTALSSDSKLLFGLLLDRLSLSSQNGWKDKNGDVFLYFTIETGCEYLGKSRPTVMKALAELDSPKGVGLIVRKKQGQGKPDKIYIRDFHQFCPKEEVDLEEKPFVENSETSEKVVKNVDYREGNSVLSLTSSGQKSCSLAVKNVAPNKPEKNKPELINSLPPSEPPENLSFPQPEKRVPEKRVRERMNQKELNALVLEELELAFQQSANNTAEAMTDLFYAYRDDKNKMISLTKHLTELFAWEEKAKDYQPYTEEMLRFTARKLYCEALGQLLTADGNCSVKGATVTYAKVIEKLAPHISRDEFGEENICIGTVMDTTICDFVKASREVEIKNPLAYMKSCLWSTLQEGTVKSEMEFRYRFG